MRVKFDGVRLGVKMKVPAIKHGREYLISSPTYHPTCVLEVGMGNQCLNGYQLLYFSAEISSYSE
jgi:hypothetical protein